MNCYGGIATGNPDAYYEPNSFNGPAEAPQFDEPSLKIFGNGDRFAQKGGEGQQVDDYTQPGNLFRLMSADQQRQLMDNIAEAMQGVPMDIVKRQIVHFHKADPSYGLGVAKRMGVPAVGLAKA